MKITYTILLISFLSMSVHAQTRGGDVVGNPFDPQQANNWTFLNEFKSAVKSAALNIGAYKGLIPDFTQCEQRSLIKAIDDTNLEVVEDKLIWQGRQVPTLNDQNSMTIYINIKDTLEYINNNAKSPSEKTNLLEKISLHEYLGIAGIEISGNMPYSDAYFNQKAFIQSNTFTSPLTNKKIKKFEKPMDLCSENDTLRILDGLEMAQEHYLSAKKRPEKRLWLSFAEKFYGDYRYSLSSFNERTLHDPGDTPSALSVNEYHAIRHPLEITGYFKKSPLTTDGFCNSFYSHQPRLGEPHELFKKDEEKYFVKNCKSIFNTLNPVEVDSLENLELCRKGKPLRGILNCIETVRNNSGRL